MRETLIGDGVFFDVVTAEETRDPNLPVVEVADERAAWRLVAALARDERNLRKLRAIVARRLVPSDRPPGREATIEQVAHLVMKRQLLLLRREVSLPMAAPPDSEELQFTAVDDTSDTTWISVRVIRDRTGEAVPDVQIEIEAPNGESTPHRTNGEGLIELRSIPHGRYHLASMSEQPDADHTLEFVGVGEVTETEEADDEWPSGPHQIRRVSPHRVSDGENLESVAEQHGLPWQELAKFNWGTADRDPIEKHLRFEVGCTKTGADGKLVFDHADDPGVIWIPQRWALRNCGVEETHVLRVRRTRHSIPVRLEDPALGLLADHDVEATYADGSQEKLQTNEHGVLHARLDRWSDDGNYVDLSFQTELREQKMRLFLVCEHADSVRGAWQRLVNLGYVQTLKPPTSEPPDPAVFEAYLEAFQANMELVPSGDLNRETVAKLESSHGATEEWSNLISTRVAPHDDSEYVAKDQVA